MNIVKQIAALVSLTFFLPVAIVAVSGFALAPFQAAAEMPQQRVVLEASDIPLAAAGAEAALPQPAEAVAPGSGEATGAPDEGPVGEPAEEPAGALAGEPAETSAEEPDTLYLSEEIAAYVESETSADAGSGSYSSDQLRTQGVIFDGGYRYTWYSQRVLPGGGLDIDGRHVSDEGYVVDSLDRLVVASSDLPYGTELDVPFGSGRAIVLDTGCAPGTIDIYTDF